MKLFDPETRGLMADSLEEFHLLEFTVVLYVELSFQSMKI